MKLRERRYESVVLSTVGSIARCFLGAFWSRERDYIEMRQYDFVINGEASAKSIKDGTFLFVNATVEMNHHHQL